MHICILYNVWSESTRVKLLLAERYFPTDFFMINSNQPAAKHLWFIMLFTLISCVVIFYPVLIRSNTLLTATDIGWPIILSSDSSTIRNSFHPTIRLQKSQRIDSSNTIIASDTIDVEHTSPTASVRIKPFVIMKNAILSVFKFYGVKLNWLLSSLKKLVSLSRFWSKTFKTPSAAAAQSAKLRNDHVQIDINTLSQRQRNIVLETYEFLRSNTTLSNLAEETNYPITHHLVYRYYAAADWSALYNGKK